MAYIYSEHLLVYIARKVIGQAKAADAVFTLIRPDSDARVIWRRTVQAAVFGPASDHLRPPEGITQIRATFKQWR
jgi:hypothetical protein